MAGDRGLLRSICPRQAQLTHPPPILAPRPPYPQQAGMSLEAYLNHPTFGLLLMICRLENNRELFTTLYAHRLFFLVSITDTGIRFEPVTRSDARTMVEVRMRALQRTGPTQEYQQVRTAYQQTFQ